MSGGLVLGVPPAVLQLVQQGLLERAFHDGLFPALMYRSEAVAAEWGANTGTAIFMSRPGLLTPIVKAFLTDNGFPYDFNDVDLLTGEARKAALAEVAQYNPNRTFPTLLIDDQVIVGFNEKKILAALGLS